MSRPLPSMIRPAVLAAALAFGAPGAAAGDLDPAAGLDELRTALRTLEAGLAAAPAAALPPEAPRTQAPGGQGPTELGRLDTRLVLSMLAQGFGNSGNADVLAAQPGGASEALILQRGRFDLEALDEALRRSGMADLGGGAAPTLRVPLVVWKDAELRLAPGETLLLDGGTGAFLANLGRLEIDGARLGGTATPAAEAAFAPFLATFGGGTIRARDAVFHDLGFGTAPKFSGVAILGSPIAAPSGRSELERNRFERLGTLALVGTPGILVAGNRFADMRGSGLIVERSADARIEGNTFHGAAPTNAIRVQEGSHRAVVRGNVVLGGDRAGILVRRDSDDVLVAGNVVWRRDGGGIKLQDVACATVADNIVLDNGQKGIEVRASDRAALRGNRIAGNHSAGIWVSDQAEGARTYVTGNAIEGNGAGIEGATAAGIALEGNDLGRQMPRLLDGDLKFQSRLLIDNLDGARPLVMSAGGTADGAAEIGARTCAELW